MTELNQCLFCVVSGKAQRVRIHTRNMLVTIVFVCCILVIVVVAGMVAKAKEEQQQKQQLNHHQNHHQPPGPSGLPIIGLGFQLDINSAHLQFTKWCKQYGDIFRFDIYGTNVVIFNSPESIRKVFCEFSELTSDRPGSFIGQYLAQSYKDILFRRYDDVCEKLKNVTLKAMYSSGIGCDDFITDQQHIINDYIKKIASRNGVDIDIVQDLELTLCRMIALLVRLIPRTYSELLFFLYPVLQKRIHKNTIYISSVSQQPPVLNTHFPTTSFHN